jgi:hypothetical protein
MVTGKANKIMALMAVMLCALAPLPVWALQAYVDRNPVVEDESFTLTLESSGDVDGEPDLSPLRRDFDIQGQGKSSNFTMINGSVSHKTQWQITLMAKHSGQLQIPSISIGSDRSQPLTVTVTPASQAQAAPGGSDLFLDVSVKPHTVYVQQQIIYTVRLYRAVSLANSSSLSEPTLPSGDAVVEKLGKDKNFETLRNGMRYKVTERSYAIYPQKSGDVDIAPVVFDGDIVQGGGGGGLFALDPFNQSVRHKRLRSKTEHITVKAMPTAFHGRQWLPARSLQLDDNWSPDPPKFAVGQAVTRTVAIMADGLTASQLPALDSAAIDGLKQYPDQPALKDTQDSSGVTGLRTEKIAYIPTRTGKVTLPAIKLAWWNTATDKMEVAGLPARTFTVAPAPADGNAPPPASVLKTPAPAVPQQQGHQVVTSPSPAPQVPPSTVSERPWWPWIALTLGLGWLATVVVWWWRRRRGPVRSTSATPEPQDSLRQLEKVLQSSCLADDAAGAKSAVLAWAQRCWPRQPPISLTAVARRCSEPLAAALIELDRALYAQTAAGWQGQELWQQFAAYKAAKSERIENRDPGLEPLYRSR